MKELLNAIKAELQTDLTYVRERDIFITEDENIIPKNVRFPCVGIKDGEIARTELTGGMWEVTLNVTLAVFVQLAKDEAGIMGDTSTGKKGVLDITDDIHASLDENTLSITGMSHAFSPSELGSEYFGDEKSAVQRKISRYQYIKEEDRA